MWFVHMTHPESLDLHLEKKVISQQFSTACCILIISSLLLKTITRVASSIPTESLIIVFIY